MTNLQTTVEALEKIVSITKGKTDSDSKNSFLWVDMAHIQDHAKAALSQVDLPSREELVELMEGFGKPDDEGRGWAVWDRDFTKMADAILALLKGAAHE